MIVFWGLIISCIIQILSAGDATGTGLPNLFSNSSYLRSFYNETHVATESESNYKSKVAISSQSPEVRWNIDGNLKTNNVDTLNVPSEDFSDLNHKIGEHFSLKIFDEEHSYQTALLEQTKAKEKNISKVPKTFRKRTLSVPPKPASNFSAVNDISIAKSSTTSFEHNFHALTRLFDHSIWNSNSFEKNMTRGCAKDISLYLKDLKDHANWALKVSDASGRYRGLFFFENDYWLGK